MDGPRLLGLYRINEQILAPPLKKGNIVFMDNVGTGVEEAIEARGGTSVICRPTVQTYRTTLLEAQSISAQNEGAYC